MDVTYPDVEVELLGHDGNAFLIIGRVAKAIRRAHGNDAATKFTEEASQQESYDALLGFVMKTVEVL